MRQRKNIDNSRTGPGDVKAKPAAMAGSFGRAALDCLKIAGEGLLGAAGELLAACFKIGLRISGRA